MAKVSALLKGLKGLQKSKKVIQAGKLFGKAKEAVKTKGLGGVAKGLKSRVRGKMSLMPQMLTPPAKPQVAGGVQQIGRLVERKVQQIVPRLTKAVQASKPQFDPKQFLGSIFSGGLSSLQNFASGLGGLQVSLQKSLGFITEAKGIIVDLIDKMAKAKGRRAKGGVIKGLLKGAAILGLGVLAVKGAPLAMKAAKTVGRAAMMMTPVGMGIMMAKKIFGRRKRGEEVKGSSKVKGSRISKNFTEALDKMESVFNILQRKVQADARFPQEPEDETKSDNQKEEEVKDEIKEEVINKNEEKKTDVKAVDAQLGTLVQDGEKLIIYPVSGVQEQKFSKVEKKSEVTESKVEGATPTNDLNSSAETINGSVDSNNLIGAEGGDGVVEFLSGKDGTDGLKGGRGPVGGVDGSNVNINIDDDPPEWWTEDDDVLLGKHDLSSGPGSNAVYYDKNGNKIDPLSPEAEALRAEALLTNPLKTDSSTSETKVNPNALDSRTDIATDISQPARKQPEVPSNMPSGGIVPIPISNSGTQPKSKDVMSMAANKVPVMPSMDFDSMHIAFAKSVFNIVDAL
tara:strand:- start:3073 stop:4779 length:1707 start_codon:yes stop_codon:yes gene_type:complete